MIVSLYNGTKYKVRCMQVNIYIYIYMYICVCVCLFVRLFSCLYVVTHVSYGYTCVYL